MKKTITTFFLTTLTTLSFAQNAPIEPVLTANTFAQPETLINPAQERKGTVYFKMGINESEIPKNGETLIPGLGFGYRAAYGHSAIDFSTDFNRKEVIDEHGEKDRHYAYNALKANYLYYLTPNTATSLYAGAGLAWAGMKDASKEFHGIISNVVLGYEVGRNSAWRTFFQMEASQPAVAAIQNGAFPGPTASFSIGSGF